MSDPHLDLLMKSLDRADEARAEQTAAIRELAGEMRKHNDSAATRHAALLEALRTRDAGVAAAIGKIEEGKSWARRTVESAVRELWSAFKVPLAGLVTAVCAYYGWVYFRIPTTPTPVPVVNVAPGNSAGLLGAASSPAAAAVPASTPNAKVP